MASITRGQRASSAQSIGPTFGRLLCGIDGSRSAYEAARQAAILTEAGSRLSLVAVAHHSGYGPTSVSLLSPDRAEAALEKAAEIVADLGITASRRLLVADDATRVLLEEGREQDILVLASHGLSRLEGIMVGSTASEAVHRAQRPVLIVRRPPNGVPFPKSILVATDGSEGAAGAIRLAAGIAGYHRSHVALLNVRHGDAPEPMELAAEAVQLIEATDTEPVLLTREGNPADRIVEAAADVGASLVVVGARGLTGLRALGSVSERVAHRAQCSVLVARPR